MRNEDKRIGYLADGHTLDDRVGFSVSLHDVGVDAHEELICSLGIICAEHCKALQDRRAAQAERAHLAYLPYRHTEWDRPRDSSLFIRWAMLRRKSIFVDSPCKPELVPMR
jgi:hypothetical protein